MSGVGGDASTVLVDVDELEPRGDDLNVDELLTNTGPTTLKPGEHPISFKNYDMSYQDFYSLFWPLNAPRDAKILLLLRWRKS